MIKPIQITDIKSKEKIWMLMELAKSVKEIWTSGVDYLDIEVDAEYKLATIKSKRLKDEIDILSKIDIELSWGEEKVLDKKTGYSITKKTGDFSPWYKDSLTLNDLLSALEGLYSFISNFVDKSDIEIRFLHYCDEVKKFYEENSSRNILMPDLFWEDIHPDIKKVAKPRFDSGHYADSVEASLKYISSRVKSIVYTKTGEDLGLDGSDLMNRVFSLKNPIIILDNLKTTSGKNIQVGYMQIFAGSMTGIRNPKAHDNIVIEKLEAIHFIYLASLLSNKLDLTID